MQNGLNFCEKQSWEFAKNRDTRSLNISSDGSTGTSMDRDGRVPTGNNFSCRAEPSVPASWFIDLQDVNKKTDIARYIAALTLHW